MTTKGDTNIIDIQGETDISDVSAPPNEACLSPPCLQGWSCCQNKSTDFTTFLNTPGCRCKTLAWVVCSVLCTSVWCLFQCTVCIVHFSVKCAFQCAVCTSMCSMHLTPVGCRAVQCITEGFSKSMFLSTGKHSNVKPLNPEKITGNLTKEVEEVVETRPPIQVSTRHPTSSLVTLCDPCIRATYFERTPSSPARGHETSRRFTLGQTETYSGRLSSTGPTIHCTLCRGE